MSLRVVSLPLSGMPYLGRTQGLVVHAQLRASSLSHSHRVPPWLRYVGVAFPHKGITVSLFTSARFW